MLLLQVINAVGHVAKPLIIPKWYTSTFTNFLILVYQIQISLQAMQNRWRYDVGDGFVTSITYRFDFSEA